MKIIKIIVMLLIMAAFYTPAFVVTMDLSNSHWIGICMGCLVIYIIWLFGYTLQVFNKWFDSKLKQEDDETA